MIVGHIGGAGSPYEIQKSLRFRANASAFISRSVLVSGNVTTWAYSAWVKRGSLASSDMVLLEAGPSSTERTTFILNSSLGITFDAYVGGVLKGRLVTTRLMRDVSAHFHVCLVYDADNAVAGDRIRLYINGVRETSVTYVAPTQGQATYISGSVTGGSHAIGKSSYAAVAYLDGYLSEINFIDGQSLDASYFGQVSVETGAWIPKKYTGTYGTNGFYLPFNDGSNLTNLTADRSGNGNNWTANNISLTSGVTYDWMDDTPTNNFCTLNPLDRGNNATFSAGLLTTSFSAVNYGHAFCTVAIPTDTYWEVTAGAANYLTAGVADTSNPSSFNWSGCWSLYQGDGKVYNNGSALTGVLATFTTNDVLGFAVKNGKLYIHKNGAWLNSGNPTADTGYVASGLPSTLFAYLGNGGGAAGTTSGSINFGQRPFAYTPPAGFKALCTKSLPTPSILNPKKHFDVKTRTGTGAAATVTGIPFAPDLVWIKARAAAYSHNITDSVRGAAKTLISNATAAEEQNRTVGYVSAFTSDGYSLSAGSSNIDEVGGATTYVDWLWKAGGAPVTNNTGSIQSQVSANPQAGFSIVTYTGTGANATVGHGLGVAPKMVIGKKRTATPTANGWAVWHTALSGSEFLLLNTADNKVSSASPWNSSVPTSSVFSVGADNGTNASGQGQVAYCFAEVLGFSKIGSYTGNGSADGPFVYCGFRPRWVLIKQATGSGVFSWQINDSVRNPSNLVNGSLYSDQSAAENTVYAAVDFLSNGFKLRTTDGAQNTNGSTYIFMAFAEAPFKYANAR